MLFFVINLVMFSWGIGLMIKGTATAITIFATMCNGIAVVLNYGEMNQ